MAPVLLGDASLRRIEGALLLIFAALVGLVEGPAQVACGALVAVAIAARVRAGERTILRRLLSRPVVLGILVWWLAGLPGLLTATERVSSQDALRPLGALAILAGGLAIPREDPRALRRLAITFLVAVTLNGAYGLLQLRLGALPLDSYLLANPRSPQIYVPGHAVDPLAERPVPGLRGVSGLYYNRLKLAHVGVVALGLYGLLAARAVTSIRLGALTLVGAGLLGSAVVLTYARAALVALAASLGVVGLVARARPSRVGAPEAGAAAGARPSSSGRLLVIAGVLLVAGLAGAAVVWGQGALDLARERLAGISTDTSERRLIFGAGWEMFLDHPLAGVGHGVYRQAASGYLPAGASGVWKTSPHNVLLQVLAETGLVGALGFFGAVVGALSTLIGRVRTGSAGPGAVLDRFATFGILAVLAIGAVHAPLHHAPVALVFWTLVGVAEGVAWRRTASAPSEGARNERV